MRAGGATLATMPKVIAALGRNIDWIAALVVCVVWFCSDQGWVAIGDAGSPDAMVKLGGETLAAAGALVLVLRGAVERMIRKVPK